MKPIGPRVLRTGAMALLLLCAHPASFAQLNQDCTVSVLNRTARVNADGSWILPNVPANFGPVRARATCVRNGVTTFGESEPFVIPANGAVNLLPQIQFSHSTPIPIALSLSAPKTTLDAIGQTTQLTVTARYSDNTTKDVTAASNFTQYTVSNPAIMTVSPSGLAQAVRNGTVIIQATHEGASGMAAINVVSGGVDTDRDGIPDDVEIANGLNPNDPLDALGDLDGDGLNNVREYQLGTNMRAADTDGDGLPDGQEVALGTSPLLADTDGDGIRDGLEVATGSDPLDPTSYDLAQALSSIDLTPAIVVLTVNTIINEASRQLTVTGRLKDATTIDLTPVARRTTYTSSNPAVCAFRSQDGLVFAGTEGTCVITVSNSGFSRQVPVLVETFAPVALSFVPIPGTANNVDASGNFAYVAAGSAGLQVVDVSDRTLPRIVASRALPGSANDVKVMGTTAYVASGAGGLQILDVTNPVSPAIVGSLSIAGIAQDVAIQGNLAFVAAGAAGLLIVDVGAPAVPRLIASLVTPGTAIGVDANLTRSRAVIAAGTTGLHVIDIANLAAPVLRATLGTGNAQDVVLSTDANYAFVADLASSFNSVDITDPAHPVGRTVTASGRLMDVAVLGPFAFGADIFFVNGVPIIDVSNPTSPLFRAVLDFRMFRDDDGTGIAVDANYAYLTGAVGGSSRLYIGQYLAVEDGPDTPAKPDLVVSNASVGAITANGNGSYSFPVTYTVTNFGRAAGQGGWTDLAYLSTNAVLDDGDQNLSGLHSHSTPLAPGESYTVTTTFTTSTTTGADDYTLFIKADGHGSAIGVGTNTDSGNVSERKESNNTVALPVALGNTVLTFDVPAMGTIDPFGDTDTYTFTLAAPERIVLQVKATSAIDPCLDLRTATGEPVSGGAVCQPSFGTARVELVLPAGTYFAHVSDSGNDETGSYNIWLEHFAGGTALSFDVPVTDTIDPFGDTDTYTFTLAAPERIVLQVKATSAIDPCLDLRTATGEPVSGGAVCQPSFGTARVELVLPAGTYFAHVSDSGNDETGSYNIWLEHFAGGTALSFDVPVTDTIDPFGDTDTYTFTLAAPERIVLQVKATSAIDPCLDLRTATGEPVSGGAVCQPSFGTARVELVLPAGTYFAHVSDSGNDETGSYNIWLEHFAGGTALSFDVPVTDTIDPFGDTDTYTFTLAAPERIVLQVKATSAIDPCLDLRTATGEPVSGGAVCQPSFGTARVELVLPAGTYFAHVSDSGNDETGSYNIWLEHFAGGTALSFDVPVTDTIDPFGDTDTYTFTLAAPERIVLQVKATSAIDPCLDLRTATGEPVSGGAVCQSSFGTARVELVLPAGTYFAHVSDSGNDETGSYNIWLEHFAGGTALSFDVPVTDTIDPFGDTDTYTFTLAAPERIVLQVKATSAIDPCLDLRTATGEPLSGGALCQPSFGTARVELVLPAGTYFAHVSDSGNDETGSYNIWLEHFAGGTALSFDVPVTDTIDPFGDTDTYTFTLAAPERIVLQVKATSAIDPCLDLRTATGEPVSGGAVCQPSFGTARVELVLPAGTYFAHVSDSGNDETGSYNIWLEHFAGGTALSFDVPVTDTIDPFGDTDTYTFTLAAPERIVLQVKATSAIDPCLDLRTATGEPVSGGAVCQPSFGTARVELVLPAGTYFAHVSDSGNDETGSYNIWLEHFAGGTALSFDVPVTDTIDPFGDTDTYTFTLAAPERIVLQVKATSAIDPCLDLRTATGEPVSGGAVCQSSFGTASIDLLLPAGTYFAHISDAANDETGTYSVLLHKP